MVTILHPQSTIYTFQQNRRDGGLLDRNDEPFCYLSRTIWCDFHLKDISLDTTDLRLRLTFGEGTNNFLFQKYSKAGFFIPHQDRSYDAVENNIGIYDHKLTKDEPLDVLVPIDNWRFGNEPSVKLKIPKKYRTSIPMIPVKLGIVIGSDPFTDENYSVNLHVHVDTKKNNQPWEKGVTSNELTFRYDAGDDWSLDEELEHIDGLNAYNIKGQGNCIHPKQTMTIEAFMTELEQREGNQRVAYIGTDTIENITSLLRAIDASGLKSKISNFDVYYIPEWDGPMLQRIRNSMNSISSIIPNTRLIRMITLEESAEQFEFNLDNQPNEKIEISPCDITVATYVAPWATSARDSSKSRFLNLLSELVNSPDSCLLSVDPKTSKDIVRGGVVNLFNISGSYSSINLVNVPTMLAYDENNSSVRVTKFVKNGGV